MGRLRKGDIITRALEFGDVGLQATAELWADLMLDSMARSHRWPQLQKQHQATVADGTEVIACPSDYGFLTRDPAQGHVGYFQATGTTGGLRVYAENLSRLRGDPLHNTDNKGTPSLVADDPTNSQWIIHPISNVAGVLSLEYQRVPAPVGSSSAVWFPDDMALMQAIRAWAEQYDRGKLVTVTIQEREASNGQGHPVPRQDAALGPGRRRGGPRPENVPSEGRNGARAGTGRRRDRPSGASLHRHRSPDRSRHRPQSRGQIHPTRANSSPARTSSPTSRASSPSAREPHS